MDNFMDKIAQKFNASEIIKANSAAEAMELKKLEAQVKEYEHILQQMRQVNLESTQAAEQAKETRLKNIEVMEQIRQLVGVSLERIEQNEQKEAATANLVEELKKSLESVWKESEDYIHKENVKVYRNVQAVVVDGLKEQTTTLSTSLSTVLATSQDKANKSMNFIKILIGITMFLVASDICIQVLRILGII